MIEKAVVDLEIGVGEDYDIEMFVEINGQRLNFEGANIYSQIRTLPNKKGHLIKDFTVTTTQVTETINEVEQTYTVIKLALTDAQTATIVHDVGYYDVLIVDANAKDAVYQKGTITFSTNVTVKPSA